MKNKWVIFIVAPLIVFLITRGISIFWIAAVLSGAILFIDLKKINKTKRDWQRILMAFAICASSIWLKVNVFYDLA